jgi:hypothetical protein
MKLNSLLTFFLIIVFSFNIFAQQNYAKEGDFKAFMQSKTLVVLNNTMLSEYNESIMTVVKNLWKITPFEFISQKEFETKKSNKAFSFLILSDATLEQKEVVMRYNILNLVLGGKAKTLNEMIDLGSVPLSYADEEENTYFYKIGGILQFMQYFVNYNLNHPNTDFIKMIRSLNGDISRKELLLLKNDMDVDVNSIEKIKTIFSGKIRFVNTENISAAITEKSADCVFLHKIGNNIKGRLCWKILFNAKTGEPLYFNYYLIDKKHPDAFTAEDFSKLKN